MLGRDGADTRRGDVVAPRNRPEDRLRAHAMGGRAYLVSKIAQSIATLAFVVAFNFFLFRVRRAIRSGSSPRGSPARISST
jgi:hypothetical protein